MRACMTHFLLRRLVIRLLEVHKLKLLMHERLVEARLSPDAVAEANLEPGSSYVIRTWL